ncbi:Neurobeachin [Myotis davidii]|uniref:Neurobeachin n=1 Tax=Myotis davidii TaxID=225400 RepID=L5LCY8_MYODS|nr:Neurobeachin [Myotis davidii]
MINPSVPIRNIRMKFAVLIGLIQVGEVSNRDIVETVLNLIWKQRPYEMSSSYTRLSSSASAALFPPTDITERLGLVPGRPLGAGRGEKPSGAIRACSRCLYPLMVLTDWGRHQVPAVGASGGCGTGSGCERRRRLLWVGLRRVGAKNFQ